jgi:hypothetical protein
MRCRHWVIRLRRQARRASAAPAGGELPSNVTRALVMALRLVGEVAFVTRGYA